MQHNLRLNALVVAVASIACALVVRSLLDANASLFVIGAFAIGVSLAELFDVELSHGASISVGAAAIMLAVVSLGRPEAVLACASGVLVVELRNRRGFQRAVYHVSGTILSTWIAASFMALEMDGWGSSGGAAFTMVAMIAWSFQFASNLLLSSLAASFNDHSPWRVVLKELFLSAFPVAPLLGVIGIVLGLTLRKFGPVSLVLSSSLLIVAYWALRARFFMESSRAWSVRYADSQAYLRDLVAGMIDGLVAVDQARRVTIVNRGAERLLGCKAADVLGADVMELGEACLPALLVRTLESGRGVVSQEMALRLNPAISAAEHNLEVLCSVSVLRDSRGRADGAVAVLQDITELKRIERRLAHLDRLTLLGEFAAGIVHEINNPLAALEMALQGAQSNLKSIVGGVVANDPVACAAESCADEPYAPEPGDKPGTYRRMSRSELAAELQADLGLAQRSVVRLEQLARRLLTFSRPAPAETGVVDVGEVLDDVLNIVAPQARSSNVRVRRDVAHGLSLIGETPGLQQIFLNLAVNAMQAMESGGELVVTAGEQETSLHAIADGVDDSAGLAGTTRLVRLLGQPQERRTESAKQPFVWVSFVDGGRGMSREVLERLGDRFFTTKPTGTGLGLAVVSRILAQYQGVMEVISREGRGSTFRLWFPQGAVAAVQRTPDGAPHAV